MTDTMQSDLVSAYRSTDYLAHGNGRDVVIQIGRHSLAVDRLLARMRARNGVFITAWNPFSKELSSKANEHWCRDLERYLISILSSRWPEIAETSAMFRPRSNSRLIPSWRRSWK
jgi:hypothetical protein